MTMPRNLGHRLSDDRGTSLMELVVGMAIMAVFMSIFTGAMLMMSNTMNKVEAYSTTTSQNTTAFMWLDRKVRYAAAISTQAQDPTTGWWNVEFEMPDNTCYQVTFVTTQNGVTVNQLKQRSWTDTGPTTYSNFVNYVPLASGVVPGTSQPLVVNNSPLVTHQQLTVNMKATSTQPGNADTYGKFTFTAMNSSVTGSNPCQQIAAGAMS